MHLLQRIKNKLECFSCEVVAMALQMILNHASRDARGSFVKKITSKMLTKDSEIVFNTCIQPANLAQLPGNLRERLIMCGCYKMTAGDLSQLCIESFEKASGGRLHYSQEGEDIVLLRILSQKNKGFFVDIGAHHATRFSNTFALYRRGWRGINIDATPNSMSSFKELRPEDINLELAISNETEPLTFYMFREGALNTFDSILADSYIKSGCELSRSVKLQTSSLADVLDNHLPNGQHIDLLSIDVEGSEMGVLLSNNWKKYSADILIIEALDTALTLLAQHPVVIFLTKQGYTPVSRLTNSVIFRRVDNICVAL